MEDFKGSSHCGAANVFICSRQEFLAGSGPRMQHRSCTQIADPGITSETHKELEKEDVS